MRVGARLDGGQLGLHGLPPLALFAQLVLARAEAGGRPPRRPP
jgi:hypothetical protein